MPRIRILLIPWCGLMGALLAASVCGPPVLAEREAPSLGALEGRPAYPWLAGVAGGAIRLRFPVPPGYARLPEPPGSFGEWLRGLPLLPGCPPVHLFDGREKADQSAHAAVIRMDVGVRDLQQCADAVIRLRAEYLFSRGCESSVAFHLTDGSVARWSDWRAGLRPVLRGRRLEWRRDAAPKGGHAAFREYLDAVFTWAGTASLARDLLPEEDPGRLSVGDVFLHPGSPGHAVIVVDAAEDARGQRIFLLAQGYMPAQEIHLLKAPGSPLDPWYVVRQSASLVTPEWTFGWNELRRFRSADCP
ncbi:MAG: DUF4846 domain-containing protein [Acidobacteriota bacterium]